MGDDFDTAASINIGQPVTRAINYGNDKDYFVFTAGISGQYIIGTTGETDVYGYLYDSNRVLMAQNDDDEESRNFKIVCNLASGQAYYVMVRHYSSSGTGSYTLVVTSQAASDDAGNDFNTAVAISVGEQITKAINFGGDYDYFEFTPSYSGAYTIETTGTTDVYGYLYDSNKSQIASDDDNGEGNNFRIEKDLISGQKYYVAVRHYSSSGTGTYTLKVFAKAPVISDVNFATASGYLLQDNYIRMHVTGQNLLHTGSTVRCPGGAELWLREEYGGSSTDRQMEFIPEEPGDYEIYVSAWNTNDSTPPATGSTLYGPLVITASKLADLVSEATNEGVQGLEIWSGGIVWQIGVGPIITGYQSSTTNIYVADRKEFRYQLNLDLNAGEAYLRKLVEAEDAEENIDATVESNADGSSATVTINGKSKAYISGQGSVRKVNGRLVILQSNFQNDLTNFFYNSGAGGGIPREGGNPSYTEIVSYIKTKCAAIGLPEDIGLAIAWTESSMTQFYNNGSTKKNDNYVNGVIDSTDWGIMQLNDKSWGTTYDFNKIKTDWRYNVDSGLSVALNRYNEAIRLGEENIPRATYSGYNTWSNIDRYRTENDPRDTHFWDYYQNKPWNTYIGNVTDPSSIPATKTARCEYIFEQPGVTRYANEPEALQHMVNVAIPVWKINSSGEKYSSTASVQVNEKLVKQVTAIFNEIYNSPEKFPIKSIGGYRWDPYDAHPAGAAIDINWEENYCIYADGTVVGKYWRPGEDVYSMPANGSVISTFKKYGWGWGGDWTSLKDYMHLTYLMC